MNILNRIKLLFPKTPVPIKEQFSGVNGMHNIKALKNGWYVNNGGNDLRQACTYSNRDDLVTKDTLSIERIEGNPNFQYDGIMKYSHEQYRDVVISIILTPNKFKNAKFALWLKSYTHDIFEIDAVEIFNRHFRFWRRLTKAIFTIHDGNNYQSNHRMRGIGVWLRTNKEYKFTLYRVNGRAIWKVNDIEILNEKDNYPNSKLGAIVDYSNEGGYLLDGDKAVLKYRDFAIYDSTFKSI